jgi:catechol 2,3-dioxygenase-like lactoylglutathione lyase family enzyme
MFDHITLRVPDLADATRAFAAVLDELEIKQTSSTPSFSVWGNFALTQTDEEHPIARRVHVAFIAPTPAHVDRFWRAGVGAGFADDGPAGPRPDYAEDYYAAFLKDPAGNGFEAVHRDGQRPKGNIDHVTIRVSDVGASASFYSTIGAAAGLMIRRQTDDRAAFSRGDRSANRQQGKDHEGAHASSCTARRASSGVKGRSRMTKSQLQRAVDNRKR